MQAPVRSGKRRAANVKRLITEHGARLPGIKNNVFQPYEAQLAAGARRIKNCLGFQQVKFRINQGRICPVVAHCAKPRCKNTMIIAEVSCIESLGG